MPVRSLSTVKIHSSALTFPTPWSCSPSPTVHKAKAKPQQVSPIYTHKIHNYVYLVLVPFTPGRRVWYAPTFGLFPCCGMYQSDLKMMSWKWFLCVATEWKLQCYAIQPQMLTCWAAGRYILVIMLLHWSLITQPHSMHNWLCADNSNVNVWPGPSSPCEGSVAETTMCHHAVVEEACKKLGGNEVLSS